MTIINLYFENPVLWRIENEYMIYYRCTSGSTKSFEFVFHSYHGLFHRLQWMKQLITTSHITNVCTLAPTHFIDCITVLLDGLINHIPFIIPTSLKAIHSLLPNLSSLRVTPSFLTSSHLTSSHSFHVFLSGELLYSSTFHYLQQQFPDAQFYNVYGGIEWGFGLCISNWNNRRLFLLSLSISGVFYWYFSTTNVWFY